MPIGYHGRAGTVVVTRHRRRPPAGSGQGAERAGADVRPEPQAGHRGRARLGGRRRLDPGRPGADGGLRRARLRRGDPERLVGAGHPGLGVRPARPVPGQELRHLDLGLGAAAGGPGRRRGRAAGAGSRTCCPTCPARATATTSTSRSSINGRRGQHLPVRGDVLLPGPDAGPHDGQRGAPADRRPVRLGHHLRARARPARQPAGAQLERHPAARAGRRPDQNLPRGRRRGGDAGGRPGWGARLGEVRGTIRPTPVASA